MSFHERIDRATTREELRDLYAEAAQVWPDYWTAQSRIEVKARQLAIPIVPISPYDLDLP